MATRKKKSATRAARPRPQRLLWWLLTAVLVVMVSFWAFVAFYTIQKYSDHWQVPPVRVLVSSPKYLSANEEEEIRFAVENNHDSNVDVAFRLVNSSPLLGFLASEGTNVFYAGPVQSQEQVNRQLKIFFPLDISQANNVLGKVAGLALWGSVGNTPAQKIADLPIGIAPIPWAKSLSNYLGTALAGLVLWLSKELWDQTKELGKKTE